MEKITYTAEQVRAAVAEKPVNAWHMLDCGFCHAPRGYEFAGTDVYWVDYCTCTGSGWRQEQRGYDEVAGMLNMQTHRDTRVRFAAVFGLPVEDAPVAP